MWAEANALKESRLCCFRELKAQPWSTVEETVRELACGKYGPHQETVYKVYIPSNELWTLL